LEIPVAEKAKPRKFTTTVACDQATLTATDGQDATSTREEQREVNA
jgi:hypothetical protein